MRDNSLSLQKDINTGAGKEHSAPHTDRSFTIIDNWILDSNLSSYEKIVYVAIKRILRQAEHAIITHDELRKVSSLSLSSIKRTIDSLISKKLVAVKSNRSKFKPNDYRLTRSSGGASRSPVSSSDRPNAGSSAGATFKNTSSKNTQLPFVCCSCKENIAEITRLLDGDEIEYEGCPICHSDLIINASRSNINAPSLLNLLNKHDPIEVFKAVDVINHKLRAGESISNFTGLLMHMLRHGIVFPESYITPSERRKRDAYLKMLKEKEEAEKKKAEAEYLAKRLEAEKRYNALNQREREALRDQAKAELPAVLQGFRQCISEKIIEILTRAKDQK